jgi:hypothetical protein
MSATAREFLTKFNTLSEEDRHEVTVEILRSLPDYGDTPGQTYDPIAAEAWGEIERTETADAQTSI